MRRSKSAARAPSVVVVTVLALVSLTGAGTGCGAQTPGTTGPVGTGSGDPPKEPADPALSGMVAAHNQVRANVKPAPASPLGLLAWSEEDAQIAHDYAEKCLFMHNPNRGTRGENLFASSGSTAAADVVKEWANEVASYDYATNKCSGMCGHYTQIVWGDTTHLGCAVKTCTTGNPFGKGSWELWVCDYSPPGNFIGKKPY